MCVGLVWHQRLSCSSWADPNSGIQMHGSEQSRAWHLYLIGRKGGGGGSITPAERRGGLRRGRWTCGARAPWLPPLPGVPPVRATVAVG